MKLLMKLRGKHKIALFSTFILCTFLIFANHIKKNKQINTLQNKLRFLEQQKKILAQTIQDNVLINRSIRNLKQKIYTEKKTAQHNSNLSQQPIKIARIARKQGLQLNICNTQKIVKRGWGHKRNAMYKMTGTIEKIKSFIKKIKTDKYQLKCKELTLSKNDTGKSQLECTLQFIQLKAKKNI